MRRRVTLLLVWLAGAAAAVGLGLLAVSLVGSSASPPAATNAGRFLAADPSGPAAPSAAPEARSGTQDTPAGTVYASCSAGVPALAAAPAAGWRVDEEQEHGRIEFHDSASAVEVSADCSSGSPSFSVDGPHAREHGGDDHHGDDHDSDDHDGDDHHGDDHHGDDG